MFKTTLKQHIDSQYFLVIPIQFCKKNCKKTERTKLVAVRLFDFSKDSNLTFESVQNE